MTFMGTFTHSLILLFLWSSVAHAGESRSGAGALSPGSRGGARDLGVTGATYEIAEPDALSEIEARAKAVDWSKYFSEKKMKQAIASYYPSGLRHLPRASETAIRSVDLSYTLEREIPDGKGGILYPRGYTFNPLQYISLPNTFVMIDGDDADQVIWFRESEYASDPKTLLLLTGGSYQILSEVVKRPVYYANAALIDRLKVRATPAVAAQKGKNMEVVEIAVPSKK